MPFIYLYEKLETGDTMKKKRTKEKTTFYSSGEYFQENPVWIVFPFSFFRCETLHPFLFPFFLKIKMESRGVKVEFKEKEKSLQRIKKWIEEERKSENRDIAIVVASWITFYSCWGK